MSEQHDQENTHLAADAASPRRGPELSRRSLLKVGGAATLAAGALAGASRARAADGDPGGTDFEAIDRMGAKREAYWKEDGKYFIQQNVDLKQMLQGVVRARVDSKWQDFAIAEVDETFFKHNIAMRTRMFEVMTGMKQYEIYNDAHNAAVGTYGSNRGDSRFHVNVAFKGIGWLPKPEKLDERIKLYEDNYLASMMTKVQILNGGYLDAGLWDRRVLCSLELYTNQSYETHTFLNQMVNPCSTLCTLADESYEFRTVARLMHYDDPSLTDWEKKVVKYINFAHDFFHGGPDKQKLIVHNIAVAYFVVEEFDNSPWGKTATAGGKKRVPAP